MAIKVDFEKFDEKGLKSLIKALEKEGLKVAAVDAPNKARRESGLQVKTAVLVFESGQKLTLKIKAGGSIFQVKLNNTVLAIKNADDIDKAVKEVAGFVTKNEEAYKKQKEKALSRVRIKREKAVNTSVAAMIETAKANLSQLTDANAALTEEITSTKETVTAYRSAISDLETELKMEQATTAKLTVELNKLREAA